MLAMPNELKEKLLACPDEPSRLAELITYSKSLYYQNPKVACDFADEILTCAEKIDHEEGVCQGLSLLGVGSIMLGNTAEGVKAVEIYRSQSWEEGYERIASVSPKETSYIDATAEEMKPHFYRLQLIGFFEEKSRLTSRVFAVAENPAPPSNISATPTASGVVIRWNEVEQENLQDYVVYRYEREQAPLRLGSVSKNDLELVDSTAQTETLYFYFVKSRDANGEESNESEEVGIRP